MERAPMGLPGRDELLERLELMIVGWTSTVGPHAAAARVAAAGPTPEPSPPAIYVVAIEGHETLVGMDRAGTNAAMVEVARRLDRLIRSQDVLGSIAPDRFVVAAAAVAPSTAGVIMERIAGAIAMPVDIDGQPVSLSVGIGVAFAFDGASAPAMLAAAEDDLDRFRAR